MKWKNRYEAARLLVPQLRSYAGEDAVILAIPRGGVPVGYEIAKALNKPLELLLVKKIGHPMNPEIAIGAVSPDHYVTDMRYKVSRSYIREQVQHIQNNLKERSKQFSAGNAVDIRGKTVIITDDGVATGYTLMEAIRLTRIKNPAKIIVAIPVAPAETAERLGKEADELICLHIDAHFEGVSRYYEDFTQTEDEEVKRLLRSFHNNHQLKTH